jgi:hypothetical protein
MRQCEAIVNDLPCGQPVFGTDKETGLGYCQRHQYLRKDIKTRMALKESIRRSLPGKVRNNTMSGKIVKPVKRFKPTGEARIFHDIWRDREHVSFLNDENLDKYEGTKQWYSLFAHVLSKKQYPKFRLKPDNIMLLSPTQHKLYDQGTKENRQNYADHYHCSWEPLFELAEQLKKEYKLL